MSEKSWKVVERKVAELLRGRRVPVSGRQRGSAPDIDHDTFSLEVKSRKALPAWLTGAMEQAEASSRNGRLPVAVLHQQGKLYADALCVMRLEDLADCLRASESSEDGAHGGYREDALSAATMKPVKAATAELGGRG